MAMGSPITGKNPSNPRRKQLRERSIISNLLCGGFIFGRKLASWKKRYFSGS
jgi:hypothetical protein